MPNFFSGLAQLAGNAAAPLADVVAAHNYAATAEKDKQRQQAMQDVAMKRQQGLDDLQRRIGESTIGLNVAHVASLNEGAWGAPVTATDESGSPILVQQHKQTGELRRAVIGGGSPPPAAATQSAPQGPSNSSATPIDANAGGRSSDVLEGQDPQQAAPPQSAAPAPKPVALSPFIRPSPTANDRTPRNFTVNGTAIAGAVDKQGRYYDNKGTMIPPGMKITPFTPPPQQSFSFPTITGPDGKQIVARANAKTGEIEPTDIAAKAGTSGGGGGSAPIAVRSGQMGLALRAAGDLFPLHDSLVKSGIPFGAEEAEKTAAGQSMLSKVPFATEIGNRMLNSKGNGDYAQYNAILPNLLLASAHAISGARINQEQVKLLGQGLKLAPGDNDLTKAQKLTNLADFLNSMKASLPPEVAQQVEGSIDPATKAILAKHGYGGPPTGYAYSEIKKVVPDFVPGATIDRVDPGATTRKGSGKTASVGSPVVAVPGTPGAKGPVDLTGKPDLATRVQQLKAAGISKQAAVVQLQHEGYDLSKPPTEEE